MAISTPHKFPVRLSPEQRQEFEAICNTGASKVRRIKRARVLLLSDHNRPEGKLTREDVSKLFGENAPKIGNPIVLIGSLLAYKA